MDESGVKRVGVRMREQNALERIKQGDPAAMASLYDLWKSRIYSMCLRYTHNVFDAEDLTQDVFIQLLRKVNTFRGDAKFSSWLYKVVLNMARLHSRREHRLRYHTLADEGEEGDVSSSQSLFRNPAQTMALTQAVSSLTPVRRMTFLLHDVEGFTHTEIAARMGGTVLASKSRLHRAHIAIRKTLRARACKIPHS
jgi:RNA polymerase sigma-70 factor (ECF subfamily)